jgi:large subunit ribosomal protein L15
MELSNLSPSKGSVTTKKKRLGRGQGSGKGGTATRGHKGAKSRSGYSKKLGFEGGQMPLQRRIPKFGFKNINRVEYQPVNLKALQLLVDNKKIKKGTVNINVLIENGLVGKNDLVKILGSGELKTALKVEAHKFSKSAQEMIEKSGGEVKVL